MKINLHTDTPHSYTYSCTLDTFKFYKQFNCSCFYQFFSRILANNFVCIITVVYCFTFQLILDNQVKAPCILKICVSSSINYKMYRDKTLETARENHRIVLNSWQFQMQDVLSQYLYYQILQKHQSLCCQSAALDVQGLLKQKR